MASYDNHFAVSSYQKLDPKLNTATEQLFSEGGILKQNTGATLQPPNSAIDAPNTKQKQQRMMARIASTKTDRAGQRNIGKKERTQPSTMMLKSGLGGSSQNRNSQKDLYSTSHHRNHAQYNHTAADTMSIAHKTIGSKNYQRKEEIGIHHGMLFENQIRVNQVIHASASAADCDLAFNQALHPSSHLHTRSFHPATNSASQPTTPLMHTESRKRQRLYKQGLVYRRNQQMKKIQIEAALNSKPSGQGVHVVKKTGVEELLESGSGSICNLNLTNPVESLR